MCTTVHLPIPTEDKETLYSARRDAPLGIPYNTSVQAGTGKVANDWANEKQISALQNPTITCIEAARTTWYCPNH